MVDALQSKQAEGKVIRVLACSNCKSLEEMPDYEGDPNYDDILITLTAKHRPGGIAHTGQLFRVPESAWNSPQTREQITNQISARLNPDATTGFGSETYVLMHTLREDAMTCWQQHLRTPDCSDYKSEGKRLVPGTSKERKELGLNPVYDAKDPRLTRYLCESCLTGDTEVVTREGLMTIGELAGKTPELLIPVETRWGHNGSARGVFRPTEVHYFGEQSILRVELSSGHARKVVRTSPEHRWIVKKGQGTTEVTSVNLKSGDVLQPLKATGPRGRENIVPFGVSQGFVFGDGGVGYGDHRPATLQIYNLEKDTALLPYFQGHEVKEVTVSSSYHGPDAKRSALKINGLPRHWKRLPPLDESRSFLLSWLAGYFAADGTVDKNGSASISSARLEHVQFVRSLASICGVGYGVVRKNMRQGFPGREKSALYSVGINARDLPDWFWIIEAHKARVVARSKTPLRERGWSVAAVIDTETTESVYCAVVPEIEVFALSDDLMTGNCPVHSLVVTAARKKAGLYDK